ncbi:tRNA modification GTPase [Flavicella marina]|uniref:tRNA modification GTPase n=1 Tax=Flavicella marina TaxID=1475951 RepID=UPI001D02B934|nr:tRNA modification GTPase [Flavicella marina]
MNKIYLLFFTIAFIFSINGNAQISFVDGYYIDNTNTKITGLIKNSDWNNNPTKFEFKVSEQAEKQTLTIDSVKEFGINDFSKHLRYDVLIDRSYNTNLDLLSSNKNPVFKKERLFLKVLIEGDATLLMYKDKSLTRYFYETTDKSIEQLIYVEYKKDNNNIAFNKEFRRQLYNNLSCTDISMDNLKHLEYKQNELLKIFVKYNTCKNSEFVNFEEKSKTDLFNLNIRPGINSSSLAISNDYARSKNIDFGNKMTFRMGLELEFIMKFNNNKWAIIVEPTYQYFTGEGSGLLSSSDTEVNYKSIELPIGIRHYMFLNEKSKFFVNGSFIYDIPFNSNIGTLDVSSKVNLALGVGYNYNNKYSLEFRYHTKRDILKDYATWISDYKTMSVIFGYTLF